MTVPLELSLKNNIITELPPFFLRQFSTNRLYMESWFWYFLLVHHLNGDDSLQLEEDTCQSRSEGFLG